MNLEKIRSRKTLKFLGLLISALVISAVSAAQLNYMYIQGSGGITTGTGLAWELGPDGTNIGANIIGNTVTNANMTANDANPQNYTNTLHIVNQDASPHTFSLEVTKSTGDLNNFTEFNLVLFAADNTTEYAVLDLTTADNATGLTIGASPAKLRILFELIPVSSPTNGAKIIFEVKLTYE